MTRTALKVEPCRSEAREKLVSAIAKRDQAAKVVMAHQGALDELRIESSETNFELRKAEGQIADAEERAVTDLVAKHLKQPAKEGPSVTHARTVVENLKETLANLGSARRQCEARLKDAEMSFADAKRAVTVAIENVVKSETETLINDFFVLRNLFQTKVVLFDMVLLGIGVREKLGMTNPVIDVALINQWKAALTSLEKDADAELPIS